MMMGFGGIGLLLMVLFWGILIAGGVWLVRAVFSNGPQFHNGRFDAQPSSPREILDRRYARGEISREEYERIKADLD
ncbi:MAG: SHOCT domain-containing protein [Anaerolineales bacterium]|nr:SHOCT domain-containing protein [Anaerolineales bacterium]